MAQYKTIRRYGLLLEMIEKQRPTFEDIKDFLARHDIQVSERTIQRDIEHIRTHYGIKILYESDPPGYYINKENSPDLPNLLRFVEVANTAAIVVESLQDGINSTLYMDFEANGSLRGYELLETLLHAIKNHRIITFTYEKYLTGEKSEYTLHPLLLKEFQTRWYLVGIRDDIGQLRVFGIDRISGIESTGDTFNPKPGFNPLDMFRHTIGINSTENQPELVELSFTELQGKYVKALPWHHSQEVLADNAEELRIRLYVNPNLEFKQRIMATGKAVKVLKPQWLAEEIRNELQANLQQYR